MDSLKTEKLSKEANAVKRSEMWLKTKITKIRYLIDKLKSTLQKIYGENIKRINLISITEKERKEEVREGKGRKKTDLTFSANMSLFIADGTK